MPTIDTVKSNTPERPFVLGIETSCDETAAAIVSADKQILAHRILSQIDAHSDYGGVVPEIAARQHISNLDHLIKDVLNTSGMALADIDAVAATTGPGLVGGLMVGVMTAKAAARAAGKPYIAVNHLEGHALTARLSEDISFPYLLLLVSGGHCQLLAVYDVGKYERLGTTIDDAVGEAYDKTAKLLGLDYPGGPAVEKAAKEGDENRFAFPKPLLNKPGCDFSFSGLKTAVRRTAEACAAEHGALQKNDRADICASFQKTVAACLTNRLKRAASLFREKASQGNLPIVVAGGVAANEYLRTELSATANELGFTFHAPPMELCTDNGAMIAWAGLERLLLDPAIDDFDMVPRARWPLDARAEPMHGKGKRGAKA